jgi:pimeloyl-ACP methyl ester carboxylesterase
MSVLDKFVDIGLKLHIREWHGDGHPFVLLHGLSSNSRTWDQVAIGLSAAGHRVITVDQRGHGLSDKPENGYDFATITADLARLIQVMDLDRPLLAGQSWGGNVLLEFGARYPNLAGGIAFIDGGYINLKMRQNPTWEAVASELNPPDLRGVFRQQLKDRLFQMHPDWSEEGVEATLHNFETMSDGTIRPWLTPDRHLRILRAMWDQQPDALYPLVSAPVLICVAEDKTNPGWTAVKSKQVNKAQTGLPLSTVYWFEDSDHDIHVQKPNALVNLMLETLTQGIWRGCVNS